MPDPAHLTIADDLHRLRRTLPLEAELTAPLARFLAACEGTLRSGTPPLRSDPAGTTPRDDASGSNPAEVDR